MNLVINYSKQSSKFLKKNSQILSRKQTILLIQKSVRKILQIEYSNVDLKALRGEYKGYFRVRYRNIRIIFSISDEGQIVIVNISAIDFRGSVY